jgi:hypothetical protein
MKATVTAALIASAALTAAGCASTAHVTKTAPAASAAPAATQAATTPSPAPTAAPTPAATARMTRKEAAAVYVAIVDPANRANDALDRDWTDRAPWSQYVADSRAYVRAARREERQLAAARWPARVQPYITSMLLTLEPAVIRCVRQQAAAGSYAAADNASYSQDCTAANDNTDPDTIRSMLGLPSRY